MTFCEQWLIIVSILDLNHLNRQKTGVDFDILRKKQAPINIWCSTSESANSNSKQNDFCTNKKYVKVKNPLFSGARVVKHIEIRNNYIKTQNLKVNIMKINSHQHLQSAFVFFANGTQKSVVIKMRNLFLNSIFWKYWNNFYPWKFHFQNFSQRHIFPYPTFLNGIKSRFEMLLKSIYIFQEVLMMRIVNFCRKN